MDDSHGRSFSPHMSPRKALAVVLGALCAFAGQAGGEDGIWGFDVSAAWSSSNQWAGGAIADGAGATAWFTNNITAARTITVDGAVASRTLGRLFAGDAEPTYYAFNIAASGGGTLTFDNNGAPAELIQMPDAAAQSISVPLVLNGALSVSNASANLLTLTGGLTGSGDLLLNASATGGITVSSKAVNNTGAVVNAGTGSGAALIGIAIGLNVTQVRQDSLTSLLTLSANNAYTGGTVVARGTLRTANGSGSATGPGPVDVLAGAMLLNDGIAAGPVTVRGGATVAGSGTLSGLVTLENGGTIAPERNGGASGGKLTVGTLDWQGGAVFHCIVTNLANSGLGAGVDYSQIAVSGTLTAAPDGTDRVIRLDSLGETLPYDPARAYGLRLLTFVTPGMATNLDLSRVTLDTNAFLAGGSWRLTNVNDAICLVNTDTPPAPEKNYWIGVNDEWNLPPYWSDSNAWSLGHAPWPGEDVVFDFYSAANCVVDIVSNGLGSLTVAEGYGGTITVNAFYPGLGEFTNMAILGDLTLNGGVLTHMANTDINHREADPAPVHRLPLSVGGDFTLGPSATINLDGRGYPAGRGPGAGTAGATTSGRSASHGGAGARNPPGSATYGSVTRPESLGSGAQTAGGGALVLEVGGTATVNGIVSAQGLNASSASYCPGSGGSIYLRAGAIGGAGTIRAGVDPTRAAYYGSGGGRIAVIATGAADLDGLTIRANTHSQTRDGGGRAGTVYLETPGSARLIVDQENIGTASDNQTELPAAREVVTTPPAIGGELEDVELVMTNGAFVGLARDLRLRGIARLDGTLSLRSLTLYLKDDPPAGAFPADYGAGTVLPAGVFHRFENGDTLVRDGRLLWGDEPATWRTAVLVYLDQGGTATNVNLANEGYVPHATALTVEAAADSAWSFGFWDGTLPAVTSRYDNPLTIASLEGNAAFRAWFRPDGMDLSHNRWVPSSTNDDWFAPFNWDLLMVPVAGQTVSLPSGSRVRMHGTPPVLASVTIETNAVLTFEGWDSVLEAADLVVSGTVTHLPQTVLTTNAAGQWVPQHRIRLKGHTLTVAAGGSVNADHAGYLPGTGPGHAPGQPGNGDDGTGYGTGGGGGYGGNGAAVWSQQYGPACGEPDDPWQPGSGGGFRPDLYGYNARPGGGAIRIEMTGGVTVDGLITARGQDGASTGGSSGSGGGIDIACETFQGGAGGRVRADGGKGFTTGGSGGGGRIALRYDPAAQAALPEPRPPVRFSAAAGLMSDEDDTNIDPLFGTLYMPDTTLLGASPTGDVVLAGQRFWHVRLYVGTWAGSWSPQSLTISNCVVGFPEGFNLHVGQDLILSGTEPPLSGAARAGLHLFAAQTNALYGARLTVGRDFTIGSNAWFYPHTHGYSGAIVGVRVGRHVTVAAGGGIDADKKGYMPDPANTNGPGAGMVRNAGGSYGGWGGVSNAMTATLGVARPPYGSAVMPLEPGSPGSWRTYGNYTATGKGGGAIQILCGGVLTADGLLTADGGTGGYYSGSGGSGGSILLSALSLKGSGTLRARGGLLSRGTGSPGNPGGGGRIAVWETMPAASAESRIAARNEQRLLPRPPPAFRGAIDVSEGRLNNLATPGTVECWYQHYTLYELR